MVIQIDSREHKWEMARVQRQLESLGVKTIVSKLYVGDYQSLDNGRLVIDRKKDLQELCGNVCQQHERFRAELLRAQEAGIQIIILCEHGPDINSLQDVYFWQNPRKHEVKWKTVNGRKIKTVESSKAVDGEQLYKSLITMRDKYGVRFEFCTKDITGQRIKELLDGE
jgi:hypothetical protein